MSYKYPTSIEEMFDERQSGESGEKGEPPAKAPASNGRKLGKSIYRSPEYPVDALGPLADLCKTITLNAQLNPATIGQSILAAASLVAQGSYEVETLAGFKPLSIYALTVAESGDGKSTAEDIVLRGVLKYEREQHKAMQAKKAEQASKPLKEQESERDPHLLASDATVQGVVRGFVTGWPSQGIFTAEGATMLCGWGMSGEQRANTSANLNKLWDGAPVSVQRGTSGRTQLYNRRFCAHWMIQPDAAQDALTDSGLSAIGFWPRFMVSWPEPLPPRKYLRYEFWNDDIVRKFWDRCAAMLREQIVTDDGECGEFHTIRLSDPAREILVKTFERMEQTRDPEHSLFNIKPFAVRLCELACRNAGVLAAYSGKNSISAELMKNGIALAVYSLDTWSGIFGLREELTHEKWARELYAWMLKRKDRRASEADILKIARPEYLRKKHARDTALAILRDCGMIRKAVDIVAGDIRIAPAEWEVISDA